MKRALLLAALAKGSSHLTGALKSDDTQLMRDALRQMGVSITEPDATSFIVTGTGRLNRPDKPLFLGNAGTATRFLTAAVAGVDGVVIVDGDDHRFRAHNQALLDLGVLRKRAVPVDVVGRDVQQHTDCRTKRRRKIDLER